MVPTLEMAGALMLQMLIAGSLFSLQPTFFTLEMPVSPETREGQRLIALRAMELCRGRYPDLGRYSFDGEEPIAGGPTAGTRPYTVRQELACRDAVPTPPAGPTVPAEWKATEADIERAMAATMSYFANVDRGDGSQIERMLSEEMRSLSEPAERAEALKAFRREAGAPGKHRVVRVTWYVNPPGVKPGAYAAVDFERQYANFSVSCGYLIWHRQADGSLLLTRQEIGNAPKAAADAQPLAELRAMLRCRD